MLHTTATIDCMGSGCLLRLVVLASISSSCHSLKHVDNVTSSDSGAVAVVYDADNDILQAVWNDRMKVDELRQNAFDMALPYRGVRATGEMQIEPNLKCDGESLSHSDELGPALTAETCQARCTMNESCDAVSFSDHHEDPACVRCTTFVMTEAPRGWAVYWITARGKIDVCSPNPCNGGQCDPDIAYPNFRCLCPVDWTGDMCERHRPTMRRYLLDPKVIAVLCSFTVTLASVITWIWHKKRVRKQWIQTRRKVATQDICGNWCDPHSQAITYRIVRPDNFEIARMEDRGVPPSTLQLVGKVLETGTAEQEKYTVRYDISSSKVSIYRSSGKEVSSAAVGELSCATGTISTIKWQTPRVTTWRKMGLEPECAPEDPQTLPLVLRMRDVSTDLLSIPIALYAEVCGMAIPANVPNVGLGIGVPSPWSNSEIVIGIHFRGPGVDVQDCVDRLRTGCASAAPRTPMLSCVEEIKLFDITFDGLCPMLPQRSRYSMDQSDSGMGSQALSGVAESWHRSSLLRRSNNSILRPNSAYPSLQRSHVSSKGRRNFARSISHDIDRRRHASAYTELEPAVRTRFVSGQSTGEAAGNTSFRRVQSHGAIQYAPSSYHPSEPTVTEQYSPDDEQNAQAVHAAENASGISLARVHGAGNHSCQSVQSHDAPSMRTPLPLYVGHPPEPTVAVHHSADDERAMQAVHAEIASSISQPHTHAVGNDSLRSVQSIGCTATDVHMYQPSEPTVTEYYSAQEEPHPQSVYPENVARVCLSEPGTATGNEAFRHLQPSEAIRSRMPSYQHSVPAVAGYYLPGDEATVHEMPAKKTSRISLPGVHAATAGEFNRSHSCRDWSSNAHTSQVRRQLSYPDHYGMTLNPATIQDTPVVYRHGGGVTVPDFFQHAHAQSGTVGTARPHGCCPPPHLLLEAVCRKSSLLLKCGQHKIVFTFIVFSLAIGSFSVLVGQLEGRQEYQTRLALFGTYNVIIGAALVLLEMIRCICCTNAQRIGTTCYTRSPLNCGLSLLAIYFGLPTSICIGCELAGYMVPDELVTALLLVALFTGSLASWIGSTRLIWCYELPGDPFEQETDLKATVKIAWLWLLFTISLTGFSVACALLLVEGASNVSSIENFLWFGSSSLACVFGGLALLGSG